MSRSLEAFGAAAGRERVPVRICFIGRAERRKGLSVLLRAFALLRGHRPEATLHVLGATRRQLLDQLHVLNGRAPELSGVEAHGWVTQEEKVEQPAQAQVARVPSVASESFGIVLAEAIAAGVPLVASDLPGYRSVLADGAAGRLVPPSEVGRLAVALEELLGDPDECRRLAGASPEAAQGLSWPRVANQILAAYEGALGAGGPQAHRRPATLVARFGWDATKAFATALHPGLAS